MDLQNRMKKAVAQSAVDQIQNGMILGLGSGSTAGTPPVSTNWPLLVVASRRWADSSSCSAVSGAAT